MLNAQIRQYFKDHWIAMAISVGSSGVVFIVSLISIFVNFRVDYFALKESVQANTTSNSTIVASQQQLLNKMSQIDQKVTDQSSEITQIYNYFFKTK